MKTSLNEKFTSVGEIIESDKSKLRPGVLAKARYNICNIDELNRNKRIYERKVWEMVQENKEVKEKLENRCLYAHAEHPSGMQSSTEKIAGLVTEFIIDDAKRKVYNVMEVLDTPEGRIVETLLRAGCGIGVSTRAEGELEECISEGTGDKYYRVVPESYRYVTTDWTADPSTYGAYPEAVERDISKIVKEGLESKKIEPDFARALLESMKCKEAVALRESLNEEEELSSAIKKAKQELYPDKDYSTLNSTEHDNVTVRARQIQKESVNEAQRQSVKEYRGVKFEIWYEVHHGYWAKGEGIAATKFKTADEAEEHAEHEIDGRLDESKKPTATFVTNETSTSSSASGVTFTIDMNEGLKFYRITNSTVTMIQAFLKQIKDLTSKSNVNLTPITDLVLKIEDAINTVTTLGESKVNEQGGSHSTGLGEIWKAFEVALNKDKSKELSESITNTEKTLVLVKEFKQLRETIAILEAENAKLAEISESDLISVRKNYIRDVKDFNKKINILQEELTATHEATQLRVTEITEKFNADKISLGESVRKEFEDTIASIEKAVLETTQKVYESKFKGLKETFTRELKELEENHNSKLMKILVRIKVREAGLDSELTPRHLTLLESCKSEQQIAAKLDEIRFLIKEGSFHSDDFKSLETPLTINVNETVTQEGKDLKESLGETLHLLKSMK